jgi:secreted PhoX family phosphatase
MSVKVLARANSKVPYANGKLSKMRFHSMPDGAAVFPLSNGYMYVSSNGDIIDYKQLLLGTTRNCSRGKTPWNTWISWEEYGKEQCWQVDPDPSTDHHTNPEMTRLGGDGGSFEAVAFDNSNPDSPIFYLTEDAELGALRRYTPSRALDGLLCTSKECTITWSFLIGKHFTGHQILMRLERFNKSTTEM